MANDKQLAKLIAHKARIDGTSLVSRLTQRTISGLHHATSHGATWQLSIGWRTNWRAFRIWSSTKANTPDL